MDSASTASTISSWVVTNRTKIAPRTSYATSGTAATHAVVLLLGDDELYCEIMGKLKSIGEFEGFLHASNIEEFTKLICGNVGIVFGGIVEAVNVNSCLEKTKLLFHIHDNMNSRGGDPAIVGERKLIEKWIVDSFYKLKKVDVFRSNLGFNNQPSVCSKNQFRTLWRTSSNADFGKERVLQRLADRNIGNGKEKMSIKQWNDEIERLLADPTANDFHIYNRIRLLTLGTTLEQDLKEAVASTSKGGEKDGDGRAGHLVSMTTDCIPPTMRSTPGAIASLLDYGCAEGALTAELGKQLKLSPSQVFGADVRMIPSEGFTFLPLASEDKTRPATIGSILPSIADHSVDVVTAAMVFHHVVHVRQVLLELRRVVSSRGVLIVREHDCTAPDTAIFLDITHGLYSLAWSQPVEWPDFLDEYEAYYRSRAQWDQLIAEAGFVRLTRGISEQALRHYDAATYSAPRKHDGRIPNVIKAYYAVYAPDPRFVIPPAPLSVASKAADDRKRSSADENSDNIKRAKVELANSAEASEEEDKLYESKKYPGRFYRINKKTGATEWVK